MHPVLVLHCLSSRAPQVSIREDHPTKELLEPPRHFPRADPLATELRSHRGFNVSAASRAREPRTVRFQYISRSSLVVNCSPSECSNGVRPIRISKKVTPSDQTSDLRVSWGMPRARSGDRYCEGCQPVWMYHREHTHLGGSVGQVAVESLARLDVVPLGKSKVH